MEEHSMMVGLEIHIYPFTRRKMYCYCSAELQDATPNSILCPICAGQPGAKPLAPNEECIRAGIRIARILGMHLAEKPVTTMRKHYFYPDLPSNYQRTSEPFATGGALGTVRFGEIHWEEDPGQYNAAKGLVDLNRSGIPLLELVTMPDIRSSKEARAFLQDLLMLLSFLGISREGAPIKVDTNISLDGGERVEVKNINSVTGVSEAIEYEYSRQSELLSRGKRVRRETRHFDEVTGETYSLRYKETLEDYRYMEDPDIAPVDISLISVPEDRNPFLHLREAVSSGVPEDEARTMLIDPPLFSLYEYLSQYTGKQFASRFVTRDVKGELNYRKLSSSWLNASFAEKVKPLAVEYAAGRLSNQNALLLLRSLFNGKDISHELKALAGNYAGINEIRETASRVLNANPGAVSRYLKGNKEVINFLVGSCMKELKGKAKAQDILAVMEELLSSVRASER